MHQMKSRTPLATLALAVTVAILVGACTSGAGNADKAGGSGEPVVLRLAIVNAGLEYTPQVRYLVDRVRELSAGNLRIDMVYKVGDFAADAEQQAVRGVASGRFDLGVVGTRVFDTLGLKSFEALTAPMLIDGYPLEQAVMDSDIPGRMMDALEKVGVTGLGILADALRKPIAVQRPLLGPADWRGVTFGIYRSEGHAEAIRALGATPVQVFGSFRDEALQNGSIKGFEFNLLSYQINVLESKAPYVTANVNLWPQTFAVIGNTHRIADLTAAQRDWLHRATDDAAKRSAAFADKDAHIIRGACVAGARFADASEADLAALHEAFAPVYANLQRDPETRAYIERIQAMKRSTPAGPGLTIPAGCTGKAPEQATSGAGTAPAYLNGTYRYQITLDEAQKAGMVDPEESYPQVTTVTLKDGEVDRVQQGCFGAGATYSVEDDRITFDSAEYGYSTTATFTRDDHGNLHLTPVPPIDPGDAFQCFSQVWTKVG